MTDQRPLGAGNPLGIDGVEFIEYVTAQPQALGAALEVMGFRAIARHRSREVMLYRQGSMNMIVNAHRDADAGSRAPDGSPALAAIALRVHDAAFAWRHTLDLGAWEIPTRASAMELNIPGIHGVGDSLIYFVDRYRDFSIYDVDFLPLPGADHQPPAVAGLHYFGVAQTIARHRTEDWIEFYRSLFGFSTRAEGAGRGLSPGGTLLASPCGQFHVRLLEPPAGPDRVAPEWDEALSRVELGAPDLPEAVRALQERGVAFADPGPGPSGARSAATQAVHGRVAFGLIAALPAARGESPEAA
jgi:4-hydroxyphenylpyruvate dioxygenase